MMLKGEAMVTCGPVRAAKPLFYRIRARLQTGYA